MSVSNRQAKSRFDSDLTGSEVILGPTHSETKDTGLLRAEGRVLSFGRRAAFAEAKLTHAGGKLYASATSTLLVFDG